MSNGYERKEMSKWGGHKYNILREEIGFIPCKDAKSNGYVVAMAYYTKIFPIRQIFMPTIIQERLRKCAEYWVMKTFENIRITFF